MLLGFVLLPVLLFGGNTFLRYFKFIKYIYPYYDMNVAVYMDGNSSMKNIAEAIGNGDGTSEPEGKTILINILLYFVLLICI